ncbi:MAG: DUF1326 domain-containing protein [Nitrososphaerales archaeon]
MKLDYVETCNCDLGCPCNFSGFPSSGYCRAIVFHHIKEGSYGDTKLDGLDVIYVGSWPKAIHQGDGTCQIYVSKKASSEQRTAMEEVFYGRAKGNSAYAIFGTTMKYFLPPQFVEIDSRLDGKNSSFSVPGLIEVKSESFKDPVTGEEHETFIRLPKGFQWKEAQAARTKVMRIVSPNMTFDYSGKNAFFVPDLEWKGP